jgi:hypothetical protein
MAHNDSSQARLVAHVDCNHVTRDELAKFPTPEATASYMPVPFIQLIETLQSQLERRSVRIVREDFAIRGDGQKLFGVFDLSMTSRDVCASMGFRTSHDKSLALQMVAGMRVFVCDNLAFSGDFIALTRKHTSRLDLRAELDGAVTRYQMHYHTLEERVVMLKQHEITDVQAKALMHDVFVQKLMPVRFMPDVAKAYFEPPHPEFEPRTEWSLHNAFTEVAKEMPLNCRMDATQEVGRFFGMLTA